MNSNSPQQASDESPFERLRAVMAALRDPAGGCPWDRAQTHATLIPYLLEETYEVVDAIERGDDAELCEELGDLLFQIVFHAQLAAERGNFVLPDVATAIADKLIRRHPHVFADATIRDADELRLAWARHKEAERRAKGLTDAESLLNGAIRAAPALMQAQDIQKRVARVGFDWPHVDGVIAKVREELEEIVEAHREGQAPARIREEVGDLLFAAVNLARHFGVDAEDALRGANNKFSGRFRALEREVRSLGKGPAECSATELEAAWVKVKQREG
ncbi:MAG: nucleoside triphosphate pyrophosphohydrolase [Thiotrichales bacterium]